VGCVVSKLRTYEGPAMDLTTLPGHRVLPGRRRAGRPAAAPARPQPILADREVPTIECVGVPRHQHRQGPVRALPPLLGRLVPGPWPRAPRTQGSGCRCGWSASIAGSRRDGQPVDPATSSRSGPGRLAPVVPLAGQLLSHTVAVLLCQQADATLRLAQLITAQPAHRVTAVT
jgi:hypothetical protein